MTKEEMDLILDQAMTLNLESMKKIGNSDQCYEYTGKVCSHLVTALILGTVSQKDKSKELAGRVVDAIKKSVEESIDILNLEAQTDGH